MEEWLSFVSKSNNKRLLLNKELPITRTSSTEALNGYVESITVGKRERVNCIFQVFTKVSPIFRIVNHSINSGFLMPVSDHHILACYINPMGILK